MSQTRTSTPYFSRGDGVELKNFGAGEVELGLVEWSAAKQPLKSNSTTKIRPNSQDSIFKMFVHLLVKCN
jgi:hypothetical protein